jgi:hypothetical protein
MNIAGSSKNSFFIALLAAAAFAAGFSGCQNPGLVESIPLPYKVPVARVEGGPVYKEGNAYWRDTRLTIEWKSAEAGPLSPNAEYSSEDPVVIAALIKFKDAWDAFEVSIEPRPYYLDDTNVPGNIEKLADGKDFVRSTESTGGKPYVKQGGYWYEQKFDVWQVPESYDGRDLVFNPDIDKISLKRFWPQDQADRKPPQYPTTKPGNWIGQPGLRWKPLQQAVSDIETMMAALQGSPLYNEEDDNPVYYVYNQMRVLIDPLLTSGPGSPASMGAEYFWIYGPPDSTFTPHGRLYEYYMGALLVPEYGATPLARSYPYPK